VEGIVEGKRRDEKKGKRGRGTAGWTMLSLAKIPAVARALSYLKQTKINRVSSFLCAMCMQI